MSTVKVIAVEPFDGRNPGDIVEVSERQSLQLISRGLAKMAGPVSNKMKPAPSNKAHPSPAAGEAQPSSASPVAQVLQPTTAQPLQSGRRRGRPPKSSPSTTAGS